MKTEESVRFWTRVQLGDIDECWLWTGPLGHQGYGEFPLADRTRHIAPYRYAYAQLVGPPPRGTEYTLDHLCRNRACVNPWHLEVVTRAENVLRGESPPARNARKTHCPQGHPYAGDNLIIETNGARACRECRRQRDRRRNRNGRRRKARVSS